jgi:hypothetical protein
MVASVFRRAMNTRNDDNRTISHVWTQQRSLARVAGSDGQHEKTMAG